MYFIKIDCFIFKHRKERWENIWGKGSGRYVPLCREWAGEQKDCVSLVCLECGGDECGKGRRGLGKQGRETQGRESGKGKWEWGENERAMGEEKQQTGREPSRRGKEKVWKEQEERGSHPGLGEDGRCSSPRSWKAMLCSCSHGKPQRKFYSRHCVLCIFNVSSWAMGGWQAGDMSGSTEK